MTEGQTHTPPGMNFAIRYLTEYAYDAEVVDNLNALRVKPQGGERQRCDEFSVRLTPEVRLHRHADYFGTEVVEFEVSRPHTQLTIDVRARVTTRAPATPPESSWEALSDEAYQESGGEFLLQTDDAPGDPVLQELIGTSRGESPLQTVLAVSELIPGRFEYRQGATFVDSTVSDLLRSGAGVCQDFVHLGLCVLRHHGIAARYVSGYLFAAGSDGDRESVEVDTHAWLEALLPLDGPGDPAWVGIDPTNRGLAGETHVKIGHGRHYADVPPIKGVYRGAASAELTASVTMTRLERTDPASIARS
ncbi:MAG TPA: transglutaminase family protein [Solirubrobacteraceae bacterium]|nr:transglutaminase family protein [Solirubrobacteraceae bacterium]